MILFGCGSLGKAFVENTGLIGQSDVLFMDNDASKWGSDVLGIPVWEPNLALLKSGRAVVVTTMQVAEVLAQLDRFGINRDCVYVPTKTLFATKPRFSQTSGPEATAFLHVVAATLNSGFEDCIACFIDSGSLLGLWRDGKLLPSKTHLDISTLGLEGTEHVALATRMAELARQNTGHSTRVESASLGYSRLVVQIDKHCFPVRIDQCVLDGETVCYAAMRHLEPVPQSFVIPTHVLAPWGLPVPGQTQQFLKHRYGGAWRTPVQDMPLVFGSLLSQDIQVLSSLDQVVAIMSRDMV